MKKVLAILGAGIVVGTVAYTVWKKLYTEGKTDTNNFENKNDNINSDESVPAVVNKTTVEDDVDVVKNTAVHNMAARHEEAAQVMKDAVDIICKRSKVAEDESEELEQISRELDDLLSED